MKIKKLLRDILQEWEIDRILTIQLLAEGREEAIEDWEGIKGDYIRRLDDILNGRGSSEHHGDTS